jgi:2-iminobutanoate/2-iminopropanoate deaminase
MKRALNPTTVAKPASLYAQAIEHHASAKRLVVSGQVGVRLDGSICEGYEAQAEQIWVNIAAILEAAGMGLKDIVAIRVYDVAPGDVQTYRRIRDRVLDGHLVAATYVIVAGLASPAFLTEIEVEAVQS